jgi:hypothetical protein
MMKKYRVRYTWGNRVYESEVYTDSSESALIWATEVIRGHNPKIVGDE